MSRLRTLLAVVVLVSLFNGAALAGAQAGPMPAGPSASQAALDSGFTYQGSLQSGGQPVTAICDFEFSLHDDLSGGLQVGVTQTVTGVSVAAGRFTVVLNSANEFGGSAFTGSARWLAVAVMCPPDGTFTPLSPRQALTAEPYALYALAAPWSGLSGVPGGFADNVDDVGVYTNGFGLALSGGAFSVLSSTVQLRVTGSCASGSSIRSIDSAGAVICQTDTAGVYTNGFGLDITSNTFSVLTGTVQARVTDTCPAGSSIRTIDAAGGVICQTDTTGVYTNGFGLALTSDTFSVLTGTIQARVAGACAPGSSIRTIDSAGGVTCESDDVGAAGNNWSLDGNAGTTTANFVGTTDNMTLTLAVNGTAALRLIPNATSPNVLGGYSGNTITGTRFGVVIAGGGESGRPNTANNYFTTISGGENNTSNSYYGVIGGGVTNTVSGSGGGTIGGGYNNTANGIATTISGGGFNTAADNGATVGGGYGNTASSSDTVGGGLFNTANGYAATISGGISNTASSSFPTVGGGFSNTAKGNYATISGGITNTAVYTGATVPGGQLNTASGISSFAAGYRSNANHDGAFVWTCQGCSATSSSGSNQFVANAAGGFWFGGAGAGPTGAITSTALISTSTGAYLSTGGAWTDVSDRNAKTAFAPVSGLDLLDALMALPVQSWNYKVDKAGVRHIGPTAQDFYAAFGVGADDTHLAALDTSGVALSAIQELYAVVLMKDAQIVAQQAEINTLQAQVGTLQAAQADVKARLAALEARSGSGPAPSPWLLLAGLGLLNLLALMAAEAFWFGRRARRTLSAR